MNEAIEAITFALGYNGGELPMYVDGRPNPAKRIRCVPRTRYEARVAALTQRIDERDSLEVALGLPRISDFVHYSTILWAWVKGSAQLEQARQLMRRRVPASIVLQMGGSSERLLMWVLREPITDTLAEVHNAKLAYALRAPRTRVKPEQLRVPVPGTFLRVDRVRPAPVLVSRLDVDSFGATLGAVAGGLKDPPPKDAWKERK